MRSKLSVLFFTLFGVNSISAQQDTVKLMAYNLLNYRNYNTTFCTNSNNNVAAKEGYLATIIADQQPDLLVCNEIGADFINAVRLTQNALNINGVSHWMQANYTVSQGSSLTNMLFFNSNKFGLLSQTVIDKDTNNVDLVRLIDVYHLYYKESNMTSFTDTVFFTVLAAHFKAGNTASDRTERSKATTAIMTYLDRQNSQGNVFIAGDFNVYSGAEPAFQDLISYAPNPSVRFYDPINVIGSWNNNNNFSFVHTQSVRSSSNGCASGGGLDDRFDFILVSDEVMNNVNRVEYVANSYQALGQDGRRFNGNINSPTNTLVSSAVANALYNMSDHLPVMASFAISPSNAVSVSELNTTRKYTFNNPVRDVLVLQKKGELFQKAQIQLIDLNGRVIYQQELCTTSIERIAIDGIPKGTYLLRLFEKGRMVTNEKLIMI
jgi:exonuclease III